MSDVYIFGNNIVIERRSNDPKPVTYSKKPAENEDFNQRFGCAGLPDGILECPIYKANVGVVRNTLLDMDLPYHHAL